ncbi:hypothetical protein PVAP13_1KG199605 [Panicum virgatum]|uniref:Uncharacterized protein n=1 Tax=Panicum virgatum TaxID=38727 RepID=A0A8T0XK38_PANVG|nr:hypothetical protein PVAP13_1KG199605 [Panicum virgatum]
MEQHAWNPCAQLHRRPITKGVTARCLDGGGRHDGGTAAALGVTPQRRRGAAGGGRCSRTMGGRGGRAGSAMLGKACGGPARGRVDVATAPLEHEGQCFLRPSVLASSGERDRGGAVRRSGGVALRQGRHGRARWRIGGVAGSGGAVLGATAEEEWRGDGGKREREPMAARSRGDGSRETDAERRQQLPRGRERAGEARVPARGSGIRGRLECAAARGRRRSLGWSARPRGGGGTVGLVASRSWCSVSHLRPKTCHAIARIRRGRATVAARGRPRWSTRGVRQPGTWHSERERGVCERAAGQSLPAPFAPFPCCAAVVGGTGGAAHTVRGKPGSTPCGAPSFRGGRWRGLQHPGGGGGARASGRRWRRSRGGRERAEQGTVQLNSRSFDPKRSGAGASRRNRAPGRPRAAPFLLPCSCPGSSPAVAPPLPPPSQRPRLGSDCGGGAPAHAPASHVGVRRDRGRSAPSTSPAPPPYGAKDPPASN